MFYAHFAPAKIRIFSDIFTIFASWRTKSKRVIKRLIKILWRIVVATASFLFAAALAIQMPQVQTFVADKVVRTLSEKFEGDISFEKIHLKPFTTLVLKNVTIIDRNPYQDKLDAASVKVDTFFRAEYIIAKFTLEGLRKHEGIHLNKAFIDNAQMNLVIEDKVDSGDGDTKTDNLSRIFQIQKPAEPKINEKEIFHIKKVEIRNMGFAMKNYESDRVLYEEGGIDWNDLDISDICLNAKGLMFKGGIMYGELSSLSFREKSGYMMNNIRGSARVGRGQTLVEGLHIEDPWSDLDLPLFTMTYDDSRSFQNFIHQVRLEGDISESRIDFNTIKYFAPELSGNDLIADISGNMSGYIDSFTFSDLRIRSEAGGFRGRTSGRLVGLPEIEDTYLQARLDDFVFTSKGLETFISEWMKENTVPDLGKYAKGTTFSLDARCTGMMNDLDIDASISSLIGKADADVKLENIVDSSRRTSISGYMNTEDLDVGRILDIDLLGPVTLKTKLKADLGSKDNPSELHIDTLKIDRLHANGYDYSEITALGDISSKGFNGSIVCHDPNLNFIFNGAFAFSSKTQNARYKFVAYLPYADLNAINIDKRGMSRVNLRASADFTRINTGNVHGRIDIGDIVLQNSTDRYDIGNINLMSYSSDSTYTIRMDSRFAAGKYSGTAPVTTFIKDVRDITLKKELPALFVDSTYVWNGNSYDLDFKFNNPMDLLSFVMPGLYIEEGTQFKASLDRKGHLSAKLHSNRLAFRKDYLKGMKAEIDNGNDALEGLIDCSELKIASLSLKDSHLDLHGKDNGLGVRFDYDNQTEMRNSGELIMHGTFDRDTDGLGIGVEFLPSSVFFNARQWNLQPSELVYRNGSVDVRNLDIVSGSERINIEGKASKENRDTLNLNLERFDISIANHLIGQDFGIKGIASGSVQLTSPLDQKGILADIICDSTSFAGTPVGTLNIGSRWNEDEENFRVFVRNEHEGNSNINAYGTFKPRGNILDMTADLDRLSISYAQPVLDEIFSEMGGYISGSIDANGPVSNLKITSNDTRLDDGRLKVAYTRVPYNLEGTLHIDETGAYFDDMSLRDDHNGTGRIEGSINWDHLRDLRFNTAISVNDVEAINIPEDAADAFYGNVSVTGNVNITGPAKSIVLNIDALTDGPGQVHVPVNTAAIGKVTNLLKFNEVVTPVAIDPYEAMMVKIDSEEDDESSLTVRVRVNAQPDVEVFVEIDKATGNVLSGHGNGLLDLEVGEDSFNINGDYILSGGSYRFAAMGLVSRDFEIEDGSSIRFNGDIMNSTLDINALYRTKASLSTLLADEESVSHKRNVNCGISLTGKLSNPEIGFSIDVPDLNPMIKSRVESAINTEDKLQKQFLWLLVSGNFLPDEQSGIVNNTTSLYSNAATELIANQLNNIFEKLDIPLDLGLNYQANESGNDMFDVAVSTQLFNNRVVVNGNIGNKQYTTSGSQNDVVGDLDIEIKLNRSGAFRLNLFSHSADQFSNYLDNSQRNGVGLMYQTEFNSFGRFIRNIFSSKAKRQEARMQEEQAMLQGKKTSIMIEDNGKQ